MFPAVGALSVPGVALHGRSRVAVSDVLAVLLPRLGLVSEKHIMGQYLSPTSVYGRPREIV